MLPHLLSPPLFLSIISSSPTLSPRLSLALPFAVFLSRPFPPAIIKLHTSTHTHKLTDAHIAVPYISITIVNDAVAFVDVVRIVAGASPCSVSLRQKFATVSVPSCVGLSHLITVSKFRRCIACAPLIVIAAAFLAPHSSLPRPPGNNLGSGVQLRRCHHRWSGQLADLRRGRRASEDIGP